MIVIMANDSKSEMSTQLNRYIAPIKTNRTTSPTDSHDYYHTSPAVGTGVTSIR